MHVKGSSEELLTLEGEAGPAVALFALSQRRQSV